VAAAEREPARVAVPRRLVRAPAATACAPVAGGGLPVRGCRRRGQRLPVPRPRIDRAPGRRTPARRAVVRGGPSVHGRDRAVPPAAHGLRPLHRRVVHLLRADRAWRMGAGGADRGHPRTGRCRSRADLRVGDAIRGGRSSGRGRVARGVQAAGRGEHGAGPHHDLHTPVRCDAGRRRGGLRRDRAGRHLRPRTPGCVRRADGGGARARPLRDVRPRSLAGAGLDGPHPAGRGRQRTAPGSDGPRGDGGPGR
jgi:hypothetical protein